MVLSKGSWTKFLVWTINIFWGSTISPSGGLSSSPNWLTIWILKWNMFHYTNSAPVCCAYLLTPWMIILIRSPCSTISVICTKVPTLKMSSKLVTTSSSLQHVQLNVIALSHRVNQMCTFLFSLKMLRHMVHVACAFSLSSRSCQDLTPVKCMLCMYLIHRLHKVMVYFQHLHKTGKYGATGYGQKWNIREFIGCVEFCKCSLVWVFLSAWVALIVTTVITTARPTGSVSPSNQAIIRSTSVARG